MVFHLGVLWYLEDAGLLAKLGRISSVSGGSIINGVLATRWSNLAWTPLPGGGETASDFEDKIAKGAPFDEALENVDVGGPAMVRAAAASNSVPISSMTITSGMWFSTASIITACCSAGVGTCMRRARPTAGCGKPHVRWCGRVTGRNPRHSTQSCAVVLHRGTASRRMRSRR